jgi:HlyD family secretion protein
MPLQTNQHNHLLINGCPKREIAEYKSFRSEEVEDILSRQPSFVEKWALLIFLLSIMLFFAGAWFISYPDVIKCNAILIAENTPREIVIRHEGRIIKLLVKNNTKVVKDQIVGLIETNANHKDVLKLSSILNGAASCLSNNKYEDVSNLFTREIYNLGELQLPYQQFITAWQQFNDYWVNGYYYRRKMFLLKNLDFLIKMHNSIEQRMGLAKEDVELSQESFDINNSLYSDKVISRQDLSDQKSRLLNKKMSIPELESALLLNENQQADKRKEIDELEHAFFQQKTNFKEAIQTLKSLVEEWKIKYVISAPIEGKIFFIIPLQENQYMLAGKVVAFINPESNKYYAQVTLSQFNFGKIKAGQKVQLRFDAYPYQEFGFVTGTLQYISQVPIDSGYLAHIELNSGLVTNYKREIPHRNGLKSQALIITDNMRLLQRLYYNIVKVMNKR